MLIHRYLQAPIDSLDNVPAIYSRLRARQQKGIESTELRNRPKHGLVSCTAVSSAHLAVSVAAYGFQI